MTKSYLVALLAAACAALLFWAGMKYAEPVPESVAPLPEITQSDGSVVAARTYEPTATAPHKIPKGYKRERTVAATVTAAPSAGCSEPVPVDVAVSIVRDGENVRAVVSAEGATVANARDIIIDPRTIATASHNWGLALRRNLTTREQGVALTYDIAPVRVGVALTRTAAGKVSPWVEVGVIW